MASHVLDSVHGVLNKARDRPASSMALGVYQREEIAGRLASRILAYGYVGWPIAHIAGM